MHKGLINVVNLICVKADQVTQELAYLSHSLT
jgi:hypothetical protein